MASPTTQPLSPDEQTLSDTFDALFSNPAVHPHLAAGAQAGHQALIDNYFKTNILDFQLSFALNRFIGGAYEDSSQ